MLAVLKRLRITLGGLMLLVLCVAVGLGWQVNRARRQREVMAAVKSHGGWVHFDYEIVKGKPTSGREPSGPRWLRRTLGDEYFQEIAFVSFVYDESSGKRFDNKDDRPCDDALALLVSQHGLKSLLLRGSQASDEGLKHLGGLIGLEDLYIWDSTHISDAGLKSLSGLVNLKNIHIDSSKVTDNGFLALKGMTKLEHLVLESHSFSFSDRGLSAVSDMDRLTWLCVGGSKARPSRITDAGLASVIGKNSLTNVDLSYSKVTDAGAAHLSTLGKLKVLNLDGCKIGDDGLKHLANLKDLKWLMLSESQIGDTGLEYLKGLSKLQVVKVQGSKVTENGRQSFRKAMTTLKMFE